MESLIRKKIRYRALYRGTKELDLLMAKIIDALLPSLSDDECEILGHLLVEDEQALYDWLIQGYSDYPAHYATIIKACRALSLAP